MEQDDVIKNLRSCLISCKGGIKLNNLKADYQTVAGEPLSFKQFGYSSLEAFIRNIPDVTVTKRNGELYVEAIPSRTTAHLTKLISRQKTTRRKIRSSAKKRPPQHRGFLPSHKSNVFQCTKSNYVGSPSSYTTSTPGKSTLYTDFSRPMPLMETIVQCPLPRNNEKPSFILCTPPTTPIKRLKEKMTNLSIATLNQSVNNCKTIEDLKCTVLNDKTAPLHVINVKPKIAELRSSTLSERLKIIPPRSTPVSPPTFSIDNNDRSFSPQIASRFEDPDPRKELEARAKALNLSPPIYKMHSQKEKHSFKITIYASVKVGTHTSHTYPQDATSEEEAEKIAARLALMDFAKEPSSPEVTTVDVKLVKERILSIITRHHSGVFMHILPEYYNEQYGEILPYNWERIIEKCAEINQEKSIGDWTILCRSSETLKRLDDNSSLSKDTSENNSSEKIHLSPIGPVAPDKLTVPEKTTWQACVTCVISTVEVWIRFGDDNENFVDMMDEMTKHYNRIKEPILASTVCNVGDFYTLFEDDYWHRVQCIDFDSETGMATVFFIDGGYEEQYEPNVLHPLDKKFCVLPAQAIRVALLGLEDFRDCVQVITIIENYLLVNRTFLVKGHKTDTDEYGSYTTVTFYDTKEDENVDVNEVLIDKILDNVTVASKVHAGQLIELYVTYIDDYDIVYAQINSPARILLNSETMSLRSVNIMMSPLVKIINCTKMYLVKWNSQWHRVRVTNVPSENKVTVFLVDVGQTVTVSKENLRYMDSISKPLQCMPPQAIQIFLHNIDESKYNGKLAAKFRELVSDTDLLLAKVIKIGTSGIPVVEIFKRIAPTNMLASINTSLIYEGELSKTNEDSNNNVKPKKRLERRNSRALEPVGKLNPPMISDIGQYFDVHVILAAHPGHFIVQPLSDTNELNSMMIDLQKVCNEYNGSPLQSIGEGKIYAGKFNDGWYRVYVTNIISDNEVSVYFCDYGDVTIVSRNSLQLLKSEFLKLPYQAVKAKLVGIEPINTDWTVNDCIRFRNLVLGKDFVSIVVESIFDHLSPANTTVLGLRLIDVSTDKDIYIDKLLVQEERAKHIEGSENC